MLATNRFAQPYAEQGNFDQKNEKHNSCILSNTHTIVKSKM